MTITVEMGAKTLLWLAEKPREELSAVDTHVLAVLKRLGYADCHCPSNLQEQNIWFITERGMRWLEKHGLRMR